MEEFNPTHIPFMERSKTSTRHKNIRSRPNSLLELGGKILFSHKHLTTHFICSKSTEHVHAKTIGSPSCNNESNLAISQRNG